MGKRRLLIAGSLLAVIGVWFALLRPTGLGGPATFIIVSGNSMEPTYSDGDLVVLRKAPAYEPGDIVAYPMMTYFDTGRLVIHRVVGSDAQGIITQGDNRDTVDSWRPTSNDIRGVAWLHIPAVGSYMTWLQQPSHLGALAAGIVLMGAIGGAAETRRRRRNGMNRHPRKYGNESSGSQLLAGYQPAIVAATTGAGLFAVLFLVLAVVAFSSETHGISTTSEPTYSESGSFDYAIKMEPSTLYPDGVLRPVEGVESQPSAFTALAREAEVTFRYEFAPGLASGELTGTISAELLIRPERQEWSRTAELLRPKPFTGFVVEETVTVNLIAVGELIAQIAEETGLDAGTYEVIVQTHIAGTGTWAGEPIEVAFEQPFTLLYERTLITPPDTLTSLVQSSSTETRVTARTLALLVWSPSVSTARTVGIVGSITILGVALAMAGYLGFELSRDEQARIRARYGSRIVDVEGSMRSTGKDAIRIASVRDLSRLAERFSTVVLHQQVGAGHRYFVRDGEDTYEYLSLSDETPTRRTRSSTQPQHVPGGDS